MVNTSKFAVKSPPGQAVEAARRRALAPSRPRPLPVPAPSPALRRRRCGEAIGRTCGTQSSGKEVIYVAAGGGRPASQRAALQLAQQASPRSAGRRPTAPFPGPKRRDSRQTRANKANEDEADDVIDLGAPRRLCEHNALAAPRRVSRRALLPNPRLYPGPKPKPKRPTPRPSAGRSRRGKRLRPVPNSRLYRPGPARQLVPPPPPARPRATWPPPAPPRALDTASRAALQLRSLAAPPSVGSPARLASPRAAEVGRARRLVVTLPEASARYRPTSQHFRARVTPGSQHSGSGASTPPAARVRPAAASAMEAAGRQSVSPEDRSEGNETLSAPSEFLAEFLSAIMRRQYAEALKYCRLILQYEPHNATARGFYPLLQHKVARAHLSDEATAEGCSSGDDADADADASHHSAGDSRSRQELMEHSADSDMESEASAAGDHSELELDSSDALHSSPSLSFSRRTDHTDRTDRTESASCASASVSASAGGGGGGGGGWESTGSASRSDADDDNGNAAPPALAPRALLTPDDLENDNAAGGGEPHHSSRLKRESVSSLQRLRAQFACSIK